MTSFFSADGGPIWMKFRRLMQNDMSTAVMWSKSKPDVQFQYGGRLGEFNGMSSQSHLPHCRVLPPGEFSIMIPELRVTLQGAATGRIQWHVIPEPRVTKWCCCLENSLSRFQTHMPHCSERAKRQGDSIHLQWVLNTTTAVRNGTVGGYGPPFHPGTTPSTLQINIP